MKTLPPEPELSRPLKVDRVPVGGIEEHIVASPTEREALAKRFGLIEIKRLEAFLNVDREEGAMLAVTGTLVAEAVQPCVVTLEPIEEAIKEQVDVLFAPAHLIKDDHEGGLGDLGEADPPEPIVGGIIDLGELAAQHFAMALNPYPRKEGASIGTIEITGKGARTETPAETRKPFAVLQWMMGKKEQEKG